MKNEDEEAKCNLIASRFCRKVEELKNGDHEDMDDVLSRNAWQDVPMLMEMSLSVLSSMMASKHIRLLRS